MAKRRWDLQLEDGAHTVELDHRYFSGRTEIRVDGRPVPVLVTADSSWFDMGRDFPLAVGTHAGVVHVRTNGVTYQYDLSIDGRSVQTGADVDRGDMPRRRNSARRFMSWYAIGAGVLFLAFGGRLVMDGIPLRYVGVLFVAVGVLGLTGVNVFRGGPLDKRRD